MKTILALCAVLAAGPAAVLVFQVSPLAVHGEEACTRENGHVIAIPQVGRLHDLCSVISERRSRSTVERISALW